MKEKIMKRNYISNNISLQLKCLIQIISISILISSCTACSDNEEEKMITDNATLFGNSYFNFEYAKAIECCTPESAVWIRYTVSNITQEDINIINSNDKNSKCKIKDIAFENDSTAIVTMNIENIFCADSIGKEGRFIQSADINLTSKLRNGKWKIALTETLNLKNIE